MFDQYFKYKMHIFFILGMSFCETGYILWHVAPFPLLPTRAQAIAIGQALVDGRWLDCVTHHDQIFRDEYALYRPLQVDILLKWLIRHFFNGVFFYVNTKVVVCLFVCFIYLFVYRAQNSQRLRPQIRTA